MSREWTPPMQWDNAGSAPSDKLVANGFTAGYKPPANVFNYFLNREKACIEELQGAVGDVETRLDEAEENIESALGERAPTNHASADATYGAASTTMYGHAKASNTVPKPHGVAAQGGETAAFARGDHVHPMQVAVQGITTAGSGAAYTATVEGIKALTAGATFIMIPHVVSTAAGCTLNVNGLGGKMLRRRLSGSTAGTVAGSASNWLTAGKPIRVTYDGTYWVVDMDKPNLADAYGSLAVEHGGFGGTTAEEARANIGAMKAMRDLWVSPDTTAEFPSQTLTVDGLSDCRDFEFEFRSRTDEGAYIMVRVHVGEEEISTEKGAEATNMYVTTSWGIVLRQRNFYINVGENSVRFNTGWIGGASTGNSNSVLIPSRIRGA